MEIIALIGVSALIVLAYYGLWGWQLNRIEDKLDKLAALLEKEERG